MKRLWRRIKIAIFGKTRVLLSELPDGHPLKGRHFLPVLTPHQLSQMKPAHREQLLDLIVEVTGGKC